MLRFVYLCCLIVVSSSGFSQVLDLNADVVPIEGQWSIATGSVDGSAGYLEIWHLPKQQWRSIDIKGSNLGLVKGHIWVKLNIYNDTQESEWYWMLNNRGIRDIKGWWLTQEGELLDQFHMGAELPYKEGRFLPIPKLNYLLQFPASQQAVLLVKIEHTGYVDLNGVFATPEAMITHIRSETLLEWLFYGIYMALLLYHCTLFISSRDISHLGYVLFVGSSFVFFLFVEGYLFSTFANTPELAYSIGQANIPLISAAASYFTLIYLDIQTSRWRITFRTIIFTGITVALIRLISPDVPSLLLGALLGFITFILIPVAALHEYFRHGNTFSLSYFAAWSLWSVLAVIISLSGIRVISLDISGFWTIMKFAFTVQNILLSWSLGVRIRSLTYQHANAQAESAAKSNLIAQVSHEIRTPMNGIIGTSQLLESHIKDEQGHQLNEVIYHSGISLLTVINDLLDLSRLETGDFELHEEPTDIKRLVTQVLLTLGSQILQKKLEQSVEYSDALPPLLMIDNVRLRQVLLNLIGNAIKYTEQGKITVICDYKYPILSISINDTGRGIPNDKISQMFQPFTQVKKDAREKRTGTGLGLHIANSIIQLMDGSIHVNSEVNKGTSVRLLLPAHEPSTAAQTTPLKDKPYIKKTSLNILIADDNAVNRTVLEGLLKRQGHQVSATNDGNQAVSEYFEHHEDIDVILMDCEMPVLDGYEAAAKIREIEAAKHLPAVAIIAVTAHAYSGHEEKVKQAGMDMQLSKPITRESIAQALFEL